MKGRNLIVVAAAAVFVSLSPVGAIAECGWYALGGASKSLKNMRRLANRVGADVYDLDDSNSPNAGKGFYAAALGPGTRNDVEVWAGRMAGKGASDAYTKNMCFYGNPL